MSDDNRLGPPEEAFLLAEQVLDLPVINQLIWRFDGPLDAQRLTAVADGLRRGPLTRRLQRARAPYARGRWVAASESAPVFRIDAAISSEDVVDWADHDAQRPFHSDRGAPWTLSAAPLDGGGHAIVFTVPHTLADGSGVYVAFEAAVAGVDIGRLPDDTGAVPGAGEDVRDAVRQVAAAVAGPARAVRMAVRKRNHEPAAASPKPPTQPVRPAMAPGPDAEASAFTVASFAESAWHEAADVRGGSANSLLTALGVGLLQAAGRIDGVDPVPVSMPVAVRTRGDRRAIATIGATVAVATDPCRYDDLRPIRRATREALGRATAPDRDREDLLRVLTPTIRVLPRKLLRAMALRQPAAVLTCSNLGAVPQLVASLGGPVPGDVVARMSVQHANVEQLRAARGGLTMWLTVSNGSATLGVLSMDPDLWPNRAALQRAVTEESAKWSLKPTFW